MAKGSETQRMMAELAGGLERAGYASMLNAGPRSWDSLRPAIEAYAAFHGLRSDAPLESLIKAVLLPRCTRPDVDYLPDGTPMPEPVQPDARTIERFLSGDLAPPEPRVEPQAGTVQATKSYQLARIPDAGDRLTRSVAELAAHSDSVWASICGLRLTIVPPTVAANIRVTDRYLGPGVLGMATVGTPGGIARAQLQQWLNPSFDWDDVLLWTTIWHEDGHNLGSGHIAGANLMAPVNNRRTQPGAGDIAFAQRHYGPPVAAPPAPEPPPAPPGQPPAAGTGTVTFAASDGRTIMVQGTWIEVARR